MRSLVTESSQVRPSVSQLTNTSEIVQILITGFGRLCEIFTEIVISILSKLHKLLTNISAHYGSEI